MVDHPGDGALHRWEEIADGKWDTLLVGNGLSINVSPKFAYDSLYEEAERATRNGKLDHRDLAIFERFGTSNFEVVLGKLRDAIAMASVLNRKTMPYRRRFRSVQLALGGVIRSVHLTRSEVPDSSLGAIKAELKNYRAIFSTSYDLIVYWAIGYEDEYAEFRDCFWGARADFDPADCRIRPGKTPVYYVHGALHLIVEGSGVTRKLTRDDRTVLDQFGEPIAVDPEARPLLITEGSARDKLRAIEGNDYLAHVYDTFKSRSEPLVVFGHALGEQDRHLIDAINANPDRPVAVSMVKKGRQELRERQSEIWGKLKTNEVYFFDAATHPLGAAVRTKPWTGFRPRARRIGGAVSRERT
jgi:hypothetical protein